MVYIFKYKRWFFWKKKTVVGHKLDKELNRMDLYFPDGTIYSVPEWSKCELYLGHDWLLFTKKQMEKESGQPISLTVGG